MKIGLITNTNFEPTLLTNELIKAQHLVVPYHLNLNLIPRHILVGLDLLILAIDNYKQMVSMIAHIKNTNQIKIIVSGPPISLLQKSHLIKIGADYYLNYQSQSSLINSIINWLCTNKSNQSNPLTFKDLVLNPNMRTLSRQKKSYRLPNKEYLLMEYFLKYPNQIHSKRTLLETIWDMNADIVSTTVETHICNLRKKIDQEFPEKRLHTIPYSGYILK